MKLLSQAGFGALLAAMSIGGALAQTAQPYDSSAPKTRAQVRADLIEWRQAGFDPLDWIDYPDNALRAGRIVAERRAQRAMQMQAQ